MRFRPARYLRPREGSPVLPGGFWRPMVSSVVWRSILQNHIAMCWKPDVGREAIWHVKTRVFACLLVLAAFPGMGRSADQPCPIISTTLGDDEWDVSSPTKFSVWIYTPDGAKPLEKPITLLFSSTGHLKVDPQKLSLDPSGTATAATISFQGTNEGLVTLKAIATGLPTRCPSLELPIDTEIGRASCRERV